MNGDTVEIQPIGLRSTASGYVAKLSPARFFIT